MRAPGKPFGAAHYTASVQYGTTSKLLSAAVTGSRRCGFTWRPSTLGFIDLAPALCTIRISGHLGATVLSASTATFASPVVGYTYVDGNTAPANSIDGDARHADGSLTPLAGSPFNAGGAGLASQGAIQVTADGRYLLAVDAGSNQISVLRLTAGGVPVLAGQPVSSGGIKPVSVAVSPFGLVYAANRGAGGSEDSGFRLHTERSSRCAICVPEHQRSERLIHG